MIEEKILRNFKKRNVLVTGGTGLIGRQVVDILCLAGANVKVVSLDNLKLNKKAEYLYGDLTSFDLCRKLTNNMDYVFHLAGVCASVDMAKKKPAAHFVATLMMSINVLESCRINNVRKSVYASSIGAYSDSEKFVESEYRIDSIPMDFAGWAKRMAELQIQAYKVQYNLDNFSIVRPANVYGPGDNFNLEHAMVIPSLLSKILRGDDPVIVWGNGESVRDFVYSKDVAEGVILASYYGTKSSFVNLGSGKGYSIKELVEAMRSFIEFNYKFDESKPAGYPVRIMDITLAKELIDYKPAISLLEGLKETWRWLKENQKEYLKKKDYFKDN